MLCNFIKYDEPACGRQVWPRIKIKYFIVWLKYYKISLNFWKAMDLWLIWFFCSEVISAYVISNHSGWNIGSRVNLSTPQCGTIFHFFSQIMICISCQSWYAIVVLAVAVKSFFNKFGRFFTQIFLAKSLIYGHGSLLSRSWKNSAVSSIKHGFWMISKAVWILCFAISSAVACISTKSIFSFCISKSGKSSLASWSLFGFQVTKISFMGSENR